MAAITKQILVTHDKTILKSLALGVDPKTWMSSYSIAQSNDTNAFGTIPNACNNTMPALT